MVNQEGVGGGGGGGGQNNRAFVSLFLCFGLWLLASEQGMKMAQTAIERVSNIGVNLGITEFAPNHQKVEELEEEEEKTPLDGEGKIG